MNPPLQDSPEGANLAKLKEKLQTRKEPPMPDQNNLAYYRSLSTARLKKMTTPEASGVLKERGVMPDQPDAAEVPIAKQQYRFADNPLAHQMLMKFKSVAAETGVDAALPDIIEGILNWHKTQQASLLKEVLGKKILFAKGSTSGIPATAVEEMLKEYEDG